MHDPLSKPLHLLGKALLDVSNTLRELPLAGDVQRATTQFVGFVLDDQLLPKFRAQVNTALTDHLRRQPAFPLDDVVANVLDHQHVVLQGVFSHPLPLGAGRCDFDVRMALAMELTPQGALRLSVEEVQSRPLGVIGQLAPPLTSAELRQAVLAQLAQMPTSDRLNVDGNIIVVDLWRELSGLMTRRP